MTTLLRFDDVTFGYEGRKLLDSFSFEIREGSCTALIGSNGIGKTTLLRIAAGSIKPQQGDVLLRGLSLRHLATKEAARTIALVPQHLEVAFPFTVQQIVEQGRTPYFGMLRGAGRDDRIAVERALALTDLSTMTHRIFNELSGGEKQRVKIALGLAQQPKLLLLDEPTQSLDIGRQIELLDLLPRLRSEGITILASMHDLHLLEGNFTDALLMTPEEPLRHGTPSEMLRPALLERAFNCPPARNPILLQRAIEQRGKTA